MTEPVKAFKLLNLLPGSSFLNSHLRPYLSMLSSSGLSLADLTGGVFS